MFDLLDTFIEFFKYSLVFVIVIFVSLKVLSDTVSTIGIYHATKKNSMHASKIKSFEDFTTKLIKICWYNYLLSFPFVIAFYVFISQLIPTSGMTNSFMLSASMTIVMLFNARILSNPTHKIKPIEYSFHSNEDELMNEMKKIKERILSFFYAFLSISVLTIVVMVIYENVVLKEQLKNLDLTFALNDVTSLIITYIFLLGIFTLIGEVILRWLDPILQIDYKSS
ncbi:MAG: hypothetical protein ACXQTM_08170 [Methanosarcinales archaeon]